MQQNQKTKKNNTLGPPLFLPSVVLFWYLLDLCVLCVGCVGYIDLIGCVDPVDPSVVCW